MKQIITIGREYGSGGRTIGRKLAERLGISFYDKEIITMTAKQSGFAESVVEQAGEKKTGSLLYGLYNASVGLPLNDQIFIAQTKIIQEIGGKESCVIVGRCADYALRDRDDVLRVFIHAPLEQRVRRVRDEYGAKETGKALEALIRKEDKNRAGYYSHFTQRDWGDMRGYHLCIDSSVGTDTAVDLLTRLAGGKA